MDKNGKQTQVFTFDLDSILLGNLEQFSVEYLSHSHRFVCVIDLG